MSMEQRVRRASDRLSSRSFVKPPVFQECITRKCEAEAQINRRCFDHWKAHKEKKKDA